MLLNSVLIYSGNRQNPFRDLFGFSNRNLISFQMRKLKTELQFMCPAILPKGITDSPPLFCLTLSIHETKALNRNTKHTKPPNRKKQNISSNGLNPYVLTSMITAKRFRLPGYLSGDSLPNN